MSYITLKHTLAKIALGVLTDPRRARVAKLLLAYARRSGARHEVSLAWLVRGTGITPEQARQLLLETGLFDQAGGSETIALAPPFQPFTPYLRRQAARTVVAVRLLEASGPPGIPEEVWRAAALFNAGLFFECHEYLEDIWRATTGADRAFYHGLVQAAAGCYHLEKGNAHGARTLIRKAIVKLEPYAPAHAGIDVAAFLSGLRGVLAALDAVPPRRTPDRSALPMLPLVDGPPSTRRMRLRRCSVRGVAVPTGSDAGRSSG